MSSVKQLDFTALRQGQVIGPEQRQFRLIKPVSNSPIGQVWHAYDLASASYERDQEKVALEILNPKLLTDEQTLESFKKQAADARQLEHKHIARTYGCFVSKEGWLFVAMETLNTRSLARILQEDGPQQLNVEKARVILNQVAQALDYAHSQHQTSHGDLTPWNVIISPGTGAKLVNFSFRQPLLHRMHAQGQTILNVEYLAPESLLALPMSPAADIYSFGCLAYQLFSGHPPFSPYDTDQQRETKELAPPAMLTDDQWATLKPCLAADPGERPTSALELMWQLFPPKTAQSTFDTQVAPAPAAVPAEKPFLQRLLAASLFPGSLLLAVGLGLGHLWGEQQERSRSQQLADKLLQAQALLVEPPSDDNHQVLSAISRDLDVLKPSTTTLQHFEQVLTAYREQLELINQQVPIRSPLPAQSAEARPVKVAQSDVAVNPGYIFRDEIEPGVYGPSMVVVPAGRFKMGDIQGEGDSDESPVHEVRIAKPFALSQYEITFADYDLFALMTSRALPDDEGWGRGNRPVINISWNDANAYAHWLKRQTGLPYRLPSEAEWEYAARAGTRSVYWWGDNTGQNNAACDDCGSRYDGKKTAPAGSFKANAFGLYDLNGNVYEWVSDCYNDTYQDAPGDGSSWQVGQCDYRVMRGGSWYDIPGVARSASRHRHPPNASRNSWGIRLALDLEEAKRS